MAKHKAKISKERQADAEFQATVDEYAQSLRKRLEELRAIRVEAPQMSGQVSMAPPQGMLAKEASFMMPIYQNQISIEDRDLAYLAGVFDVDVALGIIDHRHYYQLTISYNKNNYGILRFLSNIFGGRVRPTKIQPYHRFQGWEWHITSERAYTALRKLYPFMHFRKQHAATCLAFFEHDRHVYYSRHTSIERQATGNIYQSRLQDCQLKPYLRGEISRPKKTKQQHGTFLFQKNAETSIIPKNYRLRDIALPELELAYIAGLLDVESAFLIYKISGRPSYLLEVNYRKTDDIILQYLADIFGGRVRPAPLSSGNKRNIWLWKIGSAEAYNLLRHIYPFLRVKRQRAEICMEFFELYWRGHTTEPVSPERQAIGAKYAAKLKLYQTKSMPHKRKK